MLDESDIYITAIRLSRLMEQFAYGAR